MKKRHRMRMLVLELGGDERRQCGTKNSHRNISIPVPGLLRLISNPARGTSASHPEAGKAAIVSKTVTTLQISALCVAMGRSLCKYKIL